MAGGAEESTYTWYVKNQSQQSRDIIGWAMACATPILVALGLYLDIITPLVVTRRRSRWAGKASGFGYVLRSFPKEEKESKERNLKNERTKEREGRSQEP